MSTRANVVIKDGSEELFFYRHSDGYPEGTLPTLQKFSDWLKSGKIRNNISQASGWLILIGAIEYSTIPGYETEEVINPYNKIKGSQFVNGSLKAPQSWKVGAYEPTTGLHGDIDYKYVIDLKTAEIEIFERVGDWDQLNFDKIN